MAETRLSSVSPVITGADAASPQPTAPSSASIRTSTLSARRTSPPAMMTGLSIGRLTAMGSMDFMFNLSPVMRGLDPRIHDEAPHSQAVLIFDIAIHHGLHRNWGLPEFLTI